MLTCYFIHICLNKSLTGSVCRAALYAILLALAACAQIQPPQEMPWSASYGGDVIGEGFDTIARRYLEPVSLRTIAMTGLLGLKTVDPELSFVIDENVLVVSRSSTVAERIVVPNSGQSTAWTEATVAAIEAGRRISPALHDANAETIFRALFDGALRPLDRFSRYADAATANENRALRDGFGGIGVTIRMALDHALVLGVNAEGPAKRAGLLPNDRVTHIDGAPVAGWTQHQLVNALRGYVGTPVSITIARDNGTPDRPVTLVRDHIVPQTVNVHRDGNVEIIQLSGFNQDTADQLADAIAGALAGPAPGPSGFVLDMRSNPGGLLNRAVEVVDIFVERGQIASQRGRHAQSTQSYPATPGDATAGRPLIVLINGNSASAAEVVAAGLQDLGRAVVVGTNSFGKGTVQSVIELPNEGELTLTWSRLLAPSGYRLHGLGVLPTLCTHGGGTHITADSVIDGLRRGTLTSIGTLAKWRRSANAGDLEIAALRRTCPADGDMPATDFAVAHALIDDPALYQRALHLTGTAVAQR